MTDGKTSLCDISPDERCFIKEIDAKCPIKQRLHDLGLIPGTIVECVLQSPLKDPSAYLIRGALIALRSEEAGFIKVEVI